MTIDHDAIEPRVRLNRACREPGPCPDLEAAYLDLHDEVKRLRAELADGSFYKEVDIDRLQERAEKAEAERDALWAALTIYAQSGNWRLGGCCDPNSPNFTGEAIARAALKGDSDE